MAPKEEAGFHRDSMAQFVIGLKGGIVTRIEANGSEVEVDFPTGKTVYRPADPEGELHKTMNKTDKTIEVIVVEMKK